MPDVAVGRQELLRVIGASILVAVPISLVALAFLAAIDELQSWVWVTLPSDAGYSSPPWWWPLPWLLLAGLLVGIAVAFFPGRGGHVAADGIGGAQATPAWVPGVLFAALAGLPLGVVLGPEAPLIALGTGIALWIGRTVRLSPGGQIEALIGVAGAAAAVCVILGSPLTAVVLLVEVVALAGGPVIAVMLPALLGVGVGSLVFSGLGNTAGIQSQSLQLVQLDSVPRPDLANLLYAIPVGVVAAILMTVLFGVGQKVAGRLKPMKPAQLIAATMAAGLLVGACAAAYALITDRNPFDVASSGTQTLTMITTDPTSWGIGALLALIVFKAAAYAISLGSFRGGPIFPSIMLGGAVGVVLAPLPGLGFAGGVAIGMAAFATAAMRMPLSAFALTLLLFGSNASAVVPEVSVAVVSAFLVRTAIDKRRSSDVPATAEA
jgi:H+/Cl- antiporter ClcA